MGIESLQLKPSLHRPHLHLALLRLSHKCLVEDMSDKGGSRSPIGRRRCLSADLKSAKSSRRGRDDKELWRPLPREVRDKLDSRTSRRGISSASKKEKRDEPPTVAEPEPQPGDIGASACEELTSLIAASNAAFASAAVVDYGGSDSGDGAMDAEPSVASGDSKQAESKAVPAKRDSGAMD